jgi:hypothetical protein
VTVALFVVALVLGAVGGALGILYWLFRNWRPFG